MSATGAAVIPGQHAKRQTRIPEEEKMTRGFARIATILLGGVAAVALAASTARAEELRIGFIAPMTGIFAQIGKDMVNGFQLYLDQHGGKLGGADVKLIVEDSQGKPDTAVT